MFELQQGNFYTLCTLQLQIVITNIDCNERPLAIIEENNERVIIIMKIHLR